MCRIFMKFGTQNKLIMLMTFIQNYKFPKFGLKTEMSSNFYDIWHLDQIEHANYEYSTWN